MADEIIGNVNDPGVSSAPPAQAQTEPNSDIIGHINDANVQTQSEHFSTLPQQLLTGAESAAKVVTGGLSPAIEGDLGKALGTDQLLPENQEARSNENTLSNLAGAGAGFASGIGAAGLISGAGTAAAGALSLANPIARGAAAAAIKYSVEGALAGGENEVAKLVTNDPNQTVGTAAINIGLSGLIAGGIAAPFGAVGGAFASKLSPKIQSALESATDALESTPPTATPIDTASSQIPSGINALKESAPQLVEDAKALGLKPSIGTLSDSPFVQNIESNLGERPSVAGVALNNERRVFAKGLSDAAEGTLDTKSTVSPGTSGAAIRKSIGDTLLEELKPIEEGYEAEQPNFEAAKVGDDLKLDAVDKIANHPFVDIDPESQSIAKRVSGQIEGIKNVSDLKTVRTIIGKQLQAAFDSGRGSEPTTEILQTAKNALTEMRSSALGQAAKNGLISPESLENVAGLDARYSGLQNTLKQLGVEGGLGKSNSVRSLLERFNKFSDESFVGKVFDSGDRNSIKFFQDNFPEAFESAKSAKLKQIYEASIDHAQGKNGAFSTQKFLSKVRGLGSDEARAALFEPKDLETIGRVERLHEAFPGLYNSSKTSYAQAFAHILSPEGFVQNLTDTAQYGLLKALPHLTEAAGLAGGDEAAHLAALKFSANTEQGVNPTAFKSMADYLRATIKGDTALKNGVKNLFESGAVVLPSHLIPTEKDRKKLEKNLETASNGTNALNIGGQIGHYLPQHGTAIAESTAQAMNYLNNLKPKEIKSSPLDIPSPKSKSAEYKYNRALDIAEQPLLALQHTKNGSLLPSDVEALRQIYPGLHDRIIKQATNEIINKNLDASKIPYAQRVSLNMLMGGTPIDSTFTPFSMQQIIQANSSGHQPQPQMQGQKQARSNGGTEKALKQIDKVNALYATKDQAQQIERRQ